MLPPAWGRTSPQTPQPHPEDTTGNPRKASESWPLSVCAHTCACIPSGMKEQPRNTGSFSLRSERRPAQAPTAQIGSQDSAASVSLPPLCQRHKLIRLSAEAGSSSSRVHTAGTEVESLFSSALYLHTVAFSLLSSARSHPVK